MQVESTNELSALYPVTIVDYGNVDLLPDPIELADGVTIFSYSHEDPRIRRIVGPFPQLTERIGGSLSHFLEVKLCPYRQSLASSLLEEGIPLDETDDRLLNTACAGLVKQIALSLLLAGHTFGFYTTPWSRYLSLKNEELQGITSPAEELAGIRPMIHPQDCPPWDEHLFVTKFQALTKFYRPVGTAQNRLAVALHSLLMGVSSHHIDQRLIGLTTVFEAILGTDQANEVTHQLAERFAVIFKDNPEERLAQYKRFKILYGFRSNFVHGTLNKGHKLFKVDARGAGGKPGISDAEMAVHELKEMAVALINKVLDSPTWFSAFDGSSLQDFYLKWLFGKNPSTEI